MNDLLLFIYLLLFDIYLRIIKIKHIFIFLKIPYYYSFNNNIV